MAEESNDARKQLMRLANEGGVSLASLSSMLGRNPTYLQQFVRKGSPRKLEEGDRRKLAQFFAVEESLLIDGEGAAAIIPASDGGYTAVPRLSLDASAGPGIVDVQENSYDQFLFSGRWLREMGLRGADLSAIRVEGDSMEPLLRSGDEIFVDRNKRAGEGVHVVRIGDALHVKQVQLAGADRIKLVSANSAYPPIDLALTDVEIIGRVVWKSGRV
jgi:hypothetical protein